MHKRRHSVETTSSARLGRTFAVLMAAGGAACGGGSSSPTNAPDATVPPGEIDARPGTDCPALPGDTGAPDVFTAIVRVVDEQGEPVAGASVDVGDQTLTTNECGEVALENRSDAVMIVVSSPGFLDEPVVVGPSDRGNVVAVQLWSSNNGTRWAMHSGGDVMIGRRYEDNPYGTSLLPANDLAGGARYAVAPVARGFAAADLSTVNLETVVSSLPDTAAYPDKRITINTKPEPLVALEDLGVDLVMLGNNHIRDYMDVGITSTMAALDALHVAHVGASDGSAPANTPHILNIGDLRVGVLSWSFLTGWSQNYDYPQDGDPVPANVPAEDAWQYDPRIWGFTGATWTVPEEARRIGTAWRLFVAAEADLPADEAAAAWASLYAVYPELQDWVAGRGHGGAALWVTAQATADIAALASQVDLVIVQVHGGHEYHASPGRNMADVARAAIDAGAGVVLMHHPHILQGIEWYKGRLIAYSLGNFIFDQHYEITTPTAFLRTVWDGTELLQARMLPIDLGNYRPNPVTGSLAVRTARRIWERSISGAFSDSPESEEFTYLYPPDTDAVRGHVRMHHNDLVFSKTGPAPETVSLSVPAGSTVALGYEGLVHGRAGGAAVDLGRELFGWGGLEDMLADGETIRDLHWRVVQLDAQVKADDQAASGQGYLTMYRKSTYSTESWVSTFARTPVSEHRYYMNENGASVAADGAATYTIRLSARMNVANSPYFRLDLYTRDEARPSSSLGEYTLPFEVPADGQWHDLEIAIPAEALVAGTTEVGAFKLNIRLPPPPDGECELAIDNLQIIEWRPAAAMPDLYGAFDYVRNPGAADLSLEVRGLPLRD